MQYDLFCPECGKKAEVWVTVTDRKFSNQTQGLSYFVCKECRLMHIDINLIKKYVSCWRKDSKYAQKIPLKKIYREAIQLLDKVVDVYCKTAGYRRKRFIKK
ncbi:MAG: hypothetical protein UX07_C0006G0007 [Parcubacteria group bacterium GW2011_GWA2_45_30]|nr:MAG: hypothetical protein UX07_C0006G0007 [Parcubacteria group bacterium GW2011_GWA2_45_30]